MLSCCSSLPVSSSTETSVSAAIPRNHSFSKSVSLDAAKQVSRPKTLPSSLSDSSISGMAVKRVNTSVSKRSSGLSVSSGNQTPTLDEEDEKNGNLSSTESADSSTLSEDKRKKKKSKLLRKLLGKDSDKSK